MGIRAGCGVGRAEQGPASLGVKRVYCWQHRLQGTVNCPPRPAQLPPRHPLTALRVPLTSDQNSPWHCSPTPGTDWAQLVWAGLGCARGRAWPRGRRSLRGWVGGESPGRSVAGRPQLLCPRYAHVLTPYMNSVPAIIAKASAIHNPIIYAITHPKYRCSPGSQAHPHGHGGPAKGVSFLSLCMYWRGSSSWDQPVTVGGPGHLGRV